MCIFGTQNQEAVEFLNETMTEFRNEMGELVEKYDSDEYLDEIGGPEAVSHQVVSDLAWREFFNGAMISVRQMHYVYEQGDPYFRDRDIIVGPSEEMRDEVKHANTLANISQRFSVEMDFAQWNQWLDDVAGALVEQHRAAMVPDRAGPQYSAAELQCSTEIIAVHTLYRMPSISTRSIRTRRTRCERSPPTKTTTSTLAA